MSTTPQIPATRRAPTAHPSAAAEPAGRTLLRPLAGAALIAGPVLFAVGMATAPEQASTSQADYIASLARDETLTQVSAILLHYANIALGVGVLAASTLVRGRRGRGLTLVGSLLAAVAFINVSGAVLADWWNMATGRLLAPEQALAVFEAVQGASLLPLWVGTEPFALLGPILVFAGLARAGVLTWWTLPWFVAGVAALFTLSLVHPLVAGALVLAGFGPFALVGVRLLQRHRLQEA